MFKTDAATTMLFVALVVLCCAVIAQTMMIRHWLQVREQRVAALEMRVNNLVGQWRHHINETGE